MQTYGSRFFEVSKQQSWALWICVKRVGICKSSCFQIVTSCFVKLIKVLFSERFFVELTGKIGWVDSFDRISRLDRFIESTQLFWGYFASGNGMIVALWLFKLTFNKYNLFVNISALSHEQMFIGRRKYVGWRSLFSVVARQKVSTLYGWHLYTFICGTNG